MTSVYSGVTGSYPLSSTASPMNTMVMWMRQMRGAPTPPATSIQKWGEGVLSGLGELTL